MRRGLRQHQPMQDFARWIGKLAALAAAVLAVVWLVEAMPDGRGAAVQDAQARCRAAALAGAPLALAEGRIAAYDAAHLRAAECGRIAGQWDQGLVLRGLLAGGAAVVLVLLVAMVPGPRRD